MSEIKKRVVGRVTKKPPPPEPVRAATKARYIQFAYEYVANGRKGTQAAIDAGIKPKCAGEWCCKALKSKLVTDIIEEVTNRHLKTLRINANKILSEMALLAFSDLRDVCFWDQQSTVVKSSDELGEASKAIKKIRIKEIALKRQSKSGEDAGVEADDGNRYEMVERQIEIEMHDKTRPLEKLGNNYQLFPTHHEISGPGGGPVQLASKLTDKELESEIKKLAIRMGLIDDSDG